jgi:hypothetical protein
MQIDTFDKIYIVKHAKGTYLKVNVLPGKEVRNKMPIGTLVMAEGDFRNFYLALKAYFENQEYPPCLKIVDMRNMQRVSDEFRVKKDEANRSEPISAESIQIQNMKADGRLEPQSLGDVAEIKTKKVI